jgi:hypothetical protein
VSQQSVSVSDGSWYASSKTSESESSMDAHRQRELKWMSLMSSIPPSQSRTSKKIKKLLVEGVPSSVRFLVWTHLTDSKARGMPRVYSQLVQRGQAAVSAEIQRDVETCLDDQPRLQSAQSSLFCLLQAYFTMVPDIQYHRGKLKVFFSCERLVTTQVISCLRVDVHCRPLITPVTRRRCVLDFCRHDGYASPPILFAQCNSG